MRVIPSYLRPLMALTLLVQAILGVSDARAQVNVAPRPPAEVVLAETKQKIEQATEKAADSMDRLADRSIVRLQLAARRGAGEATLQAFADKIKRSFPGLARKGSAQVTREVGNGMIRLRLAPGYEREMQDELYAAREAATLHLLEAIDAASLALDEEVARLVAGG